MAVSGSEEQTQSNNNVKQCWEPLKLNIKRNNYNFFVK